jgi:putative DNA primase/helicase
MRASMDADERCADEDAPTKADLTRALYIDDFTENSVAKVFEVWHSKDLRFDHNAGLWFRWNGNTWQEDQTKIAFHWARRLSDRVATVNLNVKAGDLKTLGSASFARNVERFAQADRAFAITSAVWDRDLYLLGTPSGVVDLRTGELVAPRRDHFISKSSGVVPSETPDCPKWIKFLREITGNDSALIRFYQQYFGYSLTGDVKEHAMMFGYGKGGNGKGVLQRIISRLMGGYAMTAPIEMLTASDWDRHPTELARLRGARLVSASETEDGQEWKENLFKQMTGGDVITARFMRQDFFEYQPQFKLVIYSNFKPRVRNISDAMARRINMAPFNYRPAVVDHDLEERLFNEEGPQILRWLIGGCLDWQQNGLIRPPVILEATKAYFEEYDFVKRWTDERCDLGGSAFMATSAVLWKSWTEFAAEIGEKSYSQSWLKVQLERLGCIHRNRLPGIRERGFEKIRIKTTI